MSQPGISSQTIQTGKHPRGLYVLFFTEMWERFGYYFMIALNGSDTIMYLGLLSAIVGNGFFKPNISTLLGNIYNRADLRPKKDIAYNIFYMGINIGAFICNFVAAYLHNKYQDQNGWGIAFSAAGFGLVLSVIWFAFGLKHV